MCKGSSKGIAGWSKSRADQFGNRYWNIENCIEQNRLDESERGMQIRKNLKTLSSIWHALSLANQRKGTSLFVQTWVCVNDEPKEQSLLGEKDPRRLGIVTINLKGASSEVNIDEEYEEQVGKITYGWKTSPGGGVISGGETQEDINANMRALVKKFSGVFTDRTGKCRGKPIKIQVRDNAEPVIQPPRRIPLQYLSKLKQEISNMKRDDIIEGPIDIERPGTFLSNLVITEKKGTDKIRVTLDCQDVNRNVYATHEPIPTTEELRHELKGSDRFTKLDMTNCYHQFEIEEQARKLYSFRTPWGIYRYKRMVMGTSPASSEIQKRIRQIVGKCRNAIHIKDDILVHGKGREHDVYLAEVLRVLHENGITCRPDKCQLGQPEVTWFGNVYSKEGMSADPQKCAVIRNWPAPKSCSEVKSFLQTVQFNAKFLGGEPGELSYPEITESLRALTKKNVHFKWGPKEKRAFNIIKDRLCSSRVLVPYDTDRKTRLYVDSSPVGTQATLAQEHIVDGEEVWRPANHTSRAWTKAESGYGQVERESNGILSGMIMNKMYTLGTHVDFVSHKPLIPMHNTASKPKNLCGNSHRIKLYPSIIMWFMSQVKTTQCDYGSRHPPNQEFTESEKEEWCIDEGIDIRVNRLLEENIPKAMNIEDLQSETAKDCSLQSILKLVRVRDAGTCKKRHPDFYGIFKELSEVNGLVVRGHQIVIPKALQADAIGIAHEGHQASEKTLKLLRETSWFPKMGKAVQTYVDSCLACNASSSNNVKVPLEPNFLPDRPW